MVHHESAEPLQGEARSDTLSARAFFPSSEQAAIHWDLLVYNGNYVPAVNVRVRVFDRRAGALIDVMAHRIVEPEYARFPDAQRILHYDDADFEACTTMGTLMARLSTTEAPWGVLMRSSALDWMHL